MSNKSNQRVWFLLIFLSFSSAVRRGFSLGRGPLTDHDNFGEPQPPRGMAVSEGGLVFFGCRRFRSHRVWWPRFRLNESFPFHVWGYTAWALLWILRCVDRWQFSFIVNCDLKKYKKKINEIVTCDFVTVKVEFSGSVYDLKMNIINL